MVVVVAVVGRLPSVPGSCTGTFPGTRARTGARGRHDTAKRRGLQSHGQHRRSPQHRDIGHPERSPACNDGDRQQSAHYPFGVAVPGALNYDVTKHKISFAPAKALDLLANYTVTAGTGLKDLAGNSLAAEKSWSFRTADGSWDVPHEIEPATATADHAVTAQDGQGNMVVAWTSRPLGGFFEIRTAVQSSDGNWSGGSRLSTPGNYNALFPQIRFDSQGNGIALWMQLDGTGAEVWSSRFVKGVGWQAPTQLDRTTINTGYPASLAVDAEGNAFAVWGKLESQYGNSDIWGARFTPSGGWQKPVRLGSSANIGIYDQAEQPQVAVDAAGNAYVLWVQRASEAPVWVARYQVGSGWQPAVSLGASRLGDPYGPKLAVSSSGQVMALWNSFIYVGGRIASTCGGAFSRHQVATGPLRHCSKMRTAVTPSIRRSWPTTQVIFMLSGSSTAQSTAARSSIAGTPAARVGTPQRPSARRMAPTTRIVFPAWWLTAMAT